MQSFKGILSNSGTASRLLLLVGISFFFTFFSVLLWTLFTNGDSSDIDSLKVLQLLQSIGMFVIPPLLLAYFCSEKPFKYLGLDKKTNAIDIVYVTVFMLLIIPFVNLVGDLNQQLVLPKALEGIENWMKASEEEAMILTEQLLSVSTLQGLLFNIFLIALLPALGEEFIFRGAMQRILQNWKGAVFAIWITAFIFSAIHMQFYGFVPRLLLGAFFGYLMLWSGNLWLPVLAHFINNAIAVVYYYCRFNGYQFPDIDAVGTGDTMWMGVASGILMIFGGLYIKYYFRKSM
jgi:hypothetical protein